MPSATCASYHPLVESIKKTGKVLLASDASHFYENFQQRKLFPIVLDAEAIYDVDSTGAQMLLEMLDALDAIVGASIKILTHSAAALAAQDL